MTIETVLVAGASGGTGREILNQLRPTDLRVRAMTRDPGKVEVLERLGADEVVVGDLLHQPDADRAVGIGAAGRADRTDRNTGRAGGHADRAGGHADAVLCAVGTRPGLGALTGEFVDGRGVINLADAASEAGVERFVFESSIGVGDSAGGMPRAMRVLLGPILDAKDRAEARLRESGLPYTVLRAGGLTNDPPTGEVCVGEGGDSVTGRIPRADVARLMVAAPFTPEAEDRTFGVVSRAGLRGTPRNVVGITWIEPTAARSDI
jgi:uncharacterized protein YbjT (DUF2867 family)